MKMNKKKNRFEKSSIQAANPENLNTAFDRHHEKKMEQKKNLDISLALEPFSVTKKKIKRSNSEFEIVLFEDFEELPLGRKVSENIIKNSELCNPKLRMK